MTTTRTFRSGITGSARSGPPAKKVPSQAQEISCASVTNYYSKQPLGGRAWGEMQHLWALDRPNSTSIFSFSAHPDRPPVGSLQPKITSKVNRRRSSAAPQLFHPFITPTNTSVALRRRDRARLRPKETCSQSSSPIPAHRAN